MHEKEGKEMKDLPEDNPLNYQVGGDHYKHFKIQPVEFIVANKLSFLQGCIIKRICRLKPNDLDKIKHEISLMERLEVINKNDFNKAQL